MEQRERGAITASVLLIDDEEMLLKACRMILAPEGYTIYTAITGRDGLQVVREHRPDIVLIDLRLPDTNGLTLLKEIKGEYPDTVVAILTGFATIESSVQAMDAGAYDYASKPISAPQLLVLVERAAVHAKLVRANMELRKQVEERQRASPVDGRDTLVTLFDFPAPIRTACEQYLLYFTQFLQDLGIRAETDVRHRAGRVLFSVTPQDGPEALERIRDALDTFLELPSVRGFDREVGPDADVAVMQLQANIFHLKGQLAIAGAMLRAKDAEIEHLLLANGQYRQLLAASSQVGVVAGALLDSDEQDEPILGGIVTITKFEGKGFRLNLPELFRRLKRGAVDD